MLLRNTVDSILELLQIRKSFKNGFEACFFERFSVSFWSWLLSKATRVVFRAEVFQTPLNELSFSLDEPQNL